MACMATYCDTLMIDMDGLVRQQLVLNILFPGQTVNAVAEQDVVIDVFPNPASTAFRVQAGVGLQSVVVHAMDGRWICRWGANGRQTLDLPCDAWPVGVYLTEVRTTSGTVRSRLVVQR